ncbi:MAG TPA: tetratricopeptide repeat protein [Anaerolineae bacterium]|jgi:tetratricopeptide (TPR) repeat protein|nr:tetratricopeptide repeat protein [Anaerolineae bacterium]
MLVDNRSRYEVALRQGHTHSWDQQWPEAIVEFQKAIEAVDQEPAPYAGLGMAYAELGDLDQALDNYKIAARLSSGDMIYLRHVAQVQERLGQNAEAGQTYMAIGEIQLKRRKLDEAVGNWLRAVRLAPELLGAHRRLAAVYKRQGLARNAVREYLAVARIYASRGQREEALKVCQIALGLDPRNVETLTLLNLIQHEESIELFGPDDPLLASETPIEPVSETESGQELEQIADRSNGRPETGDAGSGLLDTGRRLAQSQLAQEIFGEDSAPQSAEPANLERDTLISQALDLQTRDLTDEAINSYEQALAKGAGGAAIHFCLGVLYHGKMRFGQAKREFEQSFEDASLRPASYYAIGEAYRGRGNLRRAIEYYVATLRAIDLSYLEQDKAERVSDLYAHLVSELLSEAEPRAAVEFVAALTGFLGQDGWQQRVDQARSRLDRLSADGQPLILGEILTAGSLQVLESLHLSQEYAEQGKYDSAVEEAYRAIQLSPFYLAGHIQLAELMVRQNRLQIAISKYLTIGDTCRMRGDNSGALANYERAVELSPMDLVNRARLIDLLIEQGHIDRALDHYVIMGEAFYNLAEVDKARETYLEALKLAPRGSAKYEWRLRFIQAIADIDMQRLDWKRALAAYSELSKNNPDDERIALTLIDLYYKVDQPQSAIRQLDRFLVQLVRSGEGIKVFKILEDLIEMRPTDASVVDRLVRLYLRQGRKQEALELLDSLGEAQLDAGENQAAIKTIESILAHDPPNASSYDQILQQLQQEED